VLVDPAGRVAYPGYCS
jgi:hypothetical protein